MTGFKVIMSFYLVIVISVLYFVLPSNIFAQEDKSPYEKAYQDYLNQMAVYQKVHQDYVLRKTQYESFKTLQAQQDAQVATVAMMQERDEAVITYLKALKERVNENPGLDSATITDLNIRLDTQITWFTDHKANIPTAGTLRDLSKDSNEALEGYRLSEPVFYKSLASISDGRYTDVTSRFNDRFTELKDKLTTIKGETRSEYTFSSEKIQRLDRWVFDAEARIDRAEEKQVEARNLIALYGTANKAVKNLSGAYGAILFNLSEAQIYMKEAGGFLQEIIRTIKTDD